MSISLPKCQVCQKSVMALNRIRINDMSWHKKCCRCSMCDLQLSAKSVRVDLSAGKAYCIKHCPRSKTAVLPKVIGGAGSPEEMLARLRQRSSSGGLPSAELQFLRLSVGGNYGICQIWKESICEISVDGIVNSVSITASLANGALSKAIAEAGGPEIQKELDAFRQKSPKTLDFGDVIPTNGYKLPCKHVFHAILKRWKDGQNVVQDLQQILKKIFQLAEEKKLTSLAIPPIGTGLLGYPKHIVAQVLYSEAAIYLDNHPDSCINRVIFAVNGEQDLLEIFQKLQEEEEKTAEVIYDDVILNDQPDYENFYETLYSAFSRTLDPRRTSLSTLDPLQTFQYPRNWSLTNASEKPYDRVELDPDSNEYNDVVAKISKSDGEAYLKFIAKIERLENGVSYRMYQYSKKLMIRANGSDVTNERILWHGTKADVLENIVSSGFNRIYAGDNATMYGKGVYFARDFSYSADPIYSPPERQFGLKHIFQCRVLTGNCCKGGKGLLEPDFLPDKSRRCDSAVDDVSDPSIFVVFKDYMAYPEYLISFYEDSDDGSS